MKTISQTPRYQESAFVMITCVDDADLQVVEKLRTISEIKEIQHIAGNYSIIIKIETDTPRSLKEIIDEKVRKIEKVRATTTLIASPILIF